MPADFFSFYTPILPCHNITPNINFLDLPTWKKLLPHTNYRCGFLEIDTRVRKSTRIFISSFLNLNSSIVHRRTSGAVAITCYGGGKESEKFLHNRTPSSFILSRYFLPSPPWQTQRNFVIASDEILRNNISSPRLVRVQENRIICFTLCGLLNILQKNYPTGQ